MDLCLLIFKRVDGWARREAGGRSGTGRGRYGGRRELLPRRGFIVMKTEGEADGRRRRRTPGSQTDEKEISGKAAGAEIFQQMLGKKPRRPSPWTGSQPHSLMNKGTVARRRKVQKRVEHTHTHSRAYI